MKHIAHTILSISLTLMSAIEANCQTAKLLSAETGLESNQIDNIFQDSQGYVWAVTQNGLARYDGRYFSTLHHRIGQENSLSSDLVLKMFEDSRGTVWVGTSAGLQIFDPANNTFTNFNLDGPSGRGQSKYIFEISEITDENGTPMILVSAAQHGVYVINGDTHELMPEMMDTLAELLPLQNISKMFVDSKGRLWVSSEMGGTSVANVLKKIRYDVVWSELPELAGKVTANAFAEDQESGDILISTSDKGLLIYDSASRRIQKIQGKEAEKCHTRALLTISNRRNNNTRPVFIGTSGDGFKVFEPNLI